MLMFEKKFLPPPNFEAKFANDPKVHFIEDIFIVSSSKKAEKQNDNLILKIRNIKYNLKKFFRNLYNSYHKTIFQGNCKETVISTYILRKFWAKYEWYLCNFSDITRDY